MKLLSGPLGPSSLLIIAIVLFAVPARFEGDILIRVSPGHAISELDTTAVFLLIAGSTWLYVYFWRYRARLREFMRRSPSLGRSALFVSGFGLGLLIASAFSVFYWWWIIGTVLYAFVLTAAILVVEIG